MNDRSVPPAERSGWFRKSSRRGSAAAHQPAGHGAELSVSSEPAEPTEPTEPPEHAEVPEPAQGSVESGHLTSSESSDSSEHLESAESSEPPRADKDGTDKDRIDRDGTGTTDPTDPAEDAGDSLTSARPDQPAGGVRVRARPRRAVRLPGRTRGVRRRRPYQRSTVLAAVLSVLTLVLGLSAVWLFVEVREARADESKRAEALSAARQQAVNITTSDFSTIDEDIERMINGATGDLKSDLDAQRTKYRDTFASNKLRATSQAREAGLVTMQERSATVLIVIDQTVVTDTENASPQPRRYRLELDMSLVDGTWLASGLRAHGLVS